MNWQPPLASMDRINKSRKQCIAYESLRERTELF
jgi:hypothetical protein